MNPQTLDLEARTLPRDRRGPITVGGTNIHGLDPSWLCGRTVGFKNQEPILFATSIMENIRYGMPGATGDEVSIFFISTCRSQDL